MYLIEQTYSILNNMQAIDVLISMIETLYIGTSLPSFRNVTVGSIIIILINLSVQL